MKGMFKRALSIVLSIAITVTVMPVVSIFALSDDSVLGEYAIFSGSKETPIVINSSGDTGVSINGSVQSNSGLEFNGNKLEISGSANTATYINTYDADVQIGTRNPQSATVDMPDYYGELSQLKGGEISDLSIAENSNRITVSEPISSNDKIELTADVQLTGKMGSFGSKFLAEVYSDPEKWRHVIPTFDENYVNTNNDLVDLIDNCDFIGTQESVPYNGWTGAEQLPGQVFANNYVNYSYANSYINGIRIPQNTESYEKKYGIINASGTYTAEDLEGVTDLTIEGCDGEGVTLKGVFPELKSINSNSYAYVQLLGDFPELVAISHNSYAYLNVGGNFPSLKAINKEGGSLLIGTRDCGFNADNATLLNKDGDIAIYTGNNVTLTDSTIAATNIGVFGSGNEKSPSKFIASGSVFASRNGIFLSDMNDNNTARFDEVPAFFSFSAISIVNCNFELLQGSFTFAQGNMVFANSNVDVFRGFIFAQLGIDDERFTVAEGVDVPIGVFKESTGLFGNETAWNVMYKPTVPDEAHECVGTINELETAKLPTRYTEVNNTKDFLNDIQNLDGEKRYFIGLKGIDDEKATVTVDSYVMAENNVYFFGDELNTSESQAGVIVSHNGNIEINARNIDFNGVIYAPHGKVTINCDIGKITGRIYADSIEINCKDFSIEPQNNDESLITPSVNIVVDGIDNTTSEYSITDNGDGTYTVNGSMDTICGSVTSESGIASVSYTLKNNHGVANGIISNYAAWSVEDLGLEDGVNIFIVTATNASGETLTRTIPIYYYDSPIQGCDLIVSALKTLGPVRIGEELKLLATITNIGEGNTPNGVTIQVNTYIDNELVNTTRVDMDSVESGNSETVSVNTGWIATEGRHIVKLIINEDKSIYERHYDDNYMRIVVTPSDSSATAQADSAAIVASSNDVIISEYTLCSGDEQIEGNLTVNSDLILDGCTLDVIGNLTVGSEGRIITTAYNESKITVGNDCEVEGELHLTPLSTVEINGSFDVSGKVNSQSVGGIRIGGDLTVFGTGVVNMLSDKQYGTSKMTVSGDACITGNVSVAGGATLYVTGNLYNSGESESATNGELIIFDESSTVSVGGDFLTACTGYEYNGYGNGTLEIGGSLIQNAANGQFYQGYGNTVQNTAQLLFKGGDANEVSLSSSSKYNTLGRVGVLNEKGKVLLNSSVYDITLLCNSGFGGNTSFQRLDTNGYTANIEDSLIVHSANINGKAAISGDFTVNGVAAVEGRAEVDGANAVNGSLHIDSGRMNVDEDITVSGKLYLKGVCYTAQNLYVCDSTSQDLTKGAVYLYAPTSKITVQGNFVTRSLTYSYWGYNSGMLELYGDFAQQNSSSCFIQPEGTSFKLVFAAKGDQNVSFDRVDSSSTFGNIYKSNSSGSIVFNTPVYKFTAQSDLVISAPSLVHVYSDVDVNGTIVRFKSPTQLDGNVYMNSGAIVSDGDLTFANGKVDVDGGVLIINGNAHFTGKSSLVMNDKQSMAAIKGTMYYDSPNDIKMTAGLIDIKGDYIQSTYAHFTCDESAYVQFTGAGTQTISAPSEKCLRFYYLGLNKNPNVLGNYVFPLYASGKNPMLRGYYTNCYDVTLTTKNVNTRNFGYPGVHAPSGNYSQSFTDITVPSVIGDIKITRTYNSLNSETSIVGKGFTFGYTMKLVESITESPTADNDEKIGDDETKVEVYLPGGQVWNFVQNTDGSFTAEDNRGVLKFVGENYILETPDRVTYTFKKANNDTNTHPIESLSDKYGNTISIETDNDGKIISISDNYLARLDFDYNTVGKLTQVRDSKGGMTVNYTYSGDNLTKVALTSNGETRTTTYTYNDGGLMEKIIDNAGQTMQTVKYDSEGKVSQVTDQSGAVTTYDYSESLEETSVITKPAEGMSGTEQITIQKYDESLNVYETVDALGRSSSVNYLTENGRNKYGEVRSQTDVNGNITEYERDSRGNITKTIYPDGSTVENEYDDYNNVIKTKDRNGVVSYNIYDSNGVNLLKKVTPLDGISEYSESADQSLFAIVSYSYYNGKEAGNRSDRKGLVKTETGVLGNVTKYEYDSNGLVSKKTLVVGGKEYSYTYTYNGRGLVATETDPDGNETTYEYSPFDEPTITTLTSVDGSESITQTMYDDLGRVVKEIGPTQDKENCTVTTYNAQGFVAQKTDALGNTTTYTYDVYGNVLTETLENGLINVYTYDKLNRQTSVSYKESAAEPAVLMGETVYSAIGDADQVTNIAYIDSSIKNESSTVTDFEGKTLWTKNGDGNVEANCYNSNGLLSYSIGATGVRTDYEYDVLGRVISQTSDFDGSSRSKVYYTYNAAGDVIEQSVRSNAVGSGVETLNTTRSEYDEWGNQTAVYAVDKSGKAGIVQSVYNYKGQLIKQYKGQSELLEFDENGDAVSGAVAVQSYKYNYLGKVSKYTDALGQSEISEYDAAGNIVKMTDRSGTRHTVTYNYLGMPVEKSNIGASGTITKTYEYDSMGNMTSVSDGSETIYYIYNKLGDKLSETSSNVTKDFTYNNAGDVTGYTIKRGGETLQTVANTYDNMRRPVTITENGELQATYTYDKYGRLISTAKGNGTTELITYTDGGSIKTLQNVDSKGNIQSIEKYEYYVDGNQRTKTDLTGATKYTYDSLNRLKTCVLPNGDSQTYYFDNNSNRAKLTVYNGTELVREESYSYDLNDRLTSKSETTVEDGERTTVTTQYGYDANGNQTTVENSDGETISQTFDSLNRLVSYVRSGDDAVTASYAYGADNTRSGKTVNGVVTTQIWVGSEIAVDTVNGKDITYLHGLLPIESSEYGYYSLNAHGDVTQLTDADGNVLRDYDYDPYGVQLSEQSAEDTNPYRYSGEYYDTETGYIYLRSRYYDPSNGIFISEDIAMDGVNWYAYCGGNPVMYVDPSGQLGILATILIAGALCAAVSALSVYVSDVVSNYSSGKTGGEAWKPTSSAKTYAAYAAGGFTTGALGAWAAPAVGSIEAAAAVGAFSAAEGSIVRQGIQNDMHVDYVQVANEAAAGALFSGIGAKFQGLPSKAAYADSPVPTPTPAQAAAPESTPAGGSEQNRYKSASFLERAIQRTANVNDIYASPFDDFSSPVVGPSDKIVSDYVKEIARTGGLSEPIKVQMLNSGGYEIVNGHHRWLAAKIYGLEEVPIRISNYNN